MSLSTQLSNLAQRSGTEFKAIRTLLNGNLSDLSGLNTEEKGSLVAAINEILLLVESGGGEFQPLDDDLTQIAALATTPYGRALLTLANQAALMALIPAATESVAGKAELATAAETTTGADTTRATHPAGVKAAISAAISAAAGDYQPVDSDLTAIAALATTPYGRDLLTLADQVALMGLLANATETAAGKVELATSAETTTGTDATRAVTPAGAKTAIDAAIAAAASDYQPADTDLTAIAALATTAYGRNLLTLADQAALKALLPTATAAATGLVELATTLETTTGTDDTRAVTPAGAKALVDARVEAIIDSAPAALDTLSELAAALGDDPNFAATVNAALANRVRVDAAQGLSGPQQAQARSNIGAVSAADVGDTEIDLVAIFEAALV